MAAKKQQTPVRCAGYFQMPDRMHLEDKNAKTYRERIAPTLITAEEYFATVEPKEEWHRRMEEKALSDFYGMPIKVTIAKGV